MEENDFRTMNLPEAWEFYISMVGDNETDPVYHRIRYGIKNKFDIMHVINGRVRNHVTIDKYEMMIINNVKGIEITAYETEILRRTKKLKDWLIQNYVEDEIVTPRGMNE